MPKAVLLLATLLIVALPAAAGGCTHTTSEPEFEAAGFYVEFDPCHARQLRPLQDAINEVAEALPPQQPTECMWSIWVYQESNGIPGLQRGDEIRDDTCGGMIESDTIVL